MNKKNTVTIDGKEYGLKVGFGVMMEFEEQFNKPITSIKTTKEITHLLYITLKYNNEEFEYSFKQFVDSVLDQNPSLILSLTAQIFAKDEEGSTDKKK